VRRWSAGLEFGCVLLAIACSREPAGRPPVDTEVQDVAPPPDAALSTAADPQAQAAAPTFSGVLPETYPQDAPPYVPSTLVDFGDRWVEFQTADAPATVRARLPALLRGRGWTGDGATYAKGGRTLTVRFEEARPGTRIRVEY
jgi:hypothetical protein